MGSAVPLPVTTKVRSCFIKFRALLIVYLLSWIKYHMILEYPMVPQSDPILQWFYHSSCLAQPWHWIEGFLPYQWILGLNLPKQKYLALSRFQNWNAYVVLGNTSMAQTSFILGPALIAQDRKTVLLLLLLGCLERLALQLRGWKRHVWVYMPLHCNTKSSK